MTRGNRQCERGTRPGKDGRGPPKGSKYAPFPTCLWQPQMNHTEHLSFTQGEGTESPVPSTG